MEYRTITYKEIRENPEVTALMERGNDMLGALGYTEHSKKHACKVAKGAGGHSLVARIRQAGSELARIAGYMHDIGNCVNAGRPRAQRCAARVPDPARAGHAAGRSGMRDIRHRPARRKDRYGGRSGVGGAHLADKSDVRRNRVRNRVKATFDKHDRVNYAAVAAELTVLTEKKTRPARYRAGRGDLLHSGLF